MLLHKATYLLFLQVLFKVKLSFFIKYLLVYFNVFQDDEDMPPVRLCHLRKWPDYDGYGFNLQYNQSKQQEFIGTVDPDSPADTAGIKENDRIIAVNGENIEGQSHMEVCTCNVYVFYYLFIYVCTVNALLSIARLITAVLQ